MKKAITDFLNHPLTIFYFLVGTTYCFFRLALYCINRIIATGSIFAAILGILSILISGYSLYLGLYWIKKTWELSKTFTLAAFIILIYILLTIFWSKVAIGVLNYAIYHPSFLSILAAILITILATLDFFRVILELKAISNPSSKE